MLQAHSAPDMPQTHELRSRKTIPRLPCKDSNIQTVIKEVVQLQCANP